MDHTAQTSQIFSRIKKHVQCLSVSEMRSPTWKGRIVARSHSFDADCRILAILVISSPTYYPTLNARLQNFDFGYTEISDKPSELVKKQSTQCFTSNFILYDTTPSKRSCIICGKLLAAEKFGIVSRIDLQLIPESTECCLVVAPSSN